MARHLLEEFGDVAEVVQSDSVEFLEKNNGKIDVLFFGFARCGPGG
ncbi:hypothetical protein [Fimbriiglobus ruber]|nr:hypothetical protein [Fimbriiglobus ruber]